MRSRFRLSCSKRKRSPERSTAMTFAPAAANCAVLPPGAAHRSMTVLPRTSPSIRTGSAAASDVLSLQRAAVVRWILAKDAPASAKRFSAAGVGWRENLIGLGTDDLRDALDRRIEFRVADCP